MDTPNKEDEQTFQQMWVEARTRFEATTKKSLMQSKNRSLDDVMKALDHKFNDKDPEDGGKQKRVKELAMNVLTFINLLGGIAAQGASVVFGPANLCFNAMQYLIDIPTKITKFNDDLALLFGEISAFMKQFKIYQRIEKFAEIDIELKQSTHKLMIIFVDICAISIDILSGSKLKRFKTIAKIALFDNDSGIHDKLEEFKTLVTHQGQISDAVTLEHVLKSEHDISSSMKGVFEKLSRASEESGQLLNEMQDTHEDVRTIKAGTEALTRDATERNMEKNWNEQVSKIASKLTVSSDAVQTPEKDFDQIRSASIQGTGAWLKSIDIYKEWIDLEAGSNPLLLLSGSNGSGKSVLVSAILEELRVRIKNVGNNSTRVSLACYGFRKNEKLSRDTSSKDSHQAATALKYMAVQIAKQNEPYAKNLFSHLEPKDRSFSRDMSVKELSKELLPPPSMKDSSDMFYILLLDGLDQLPPDEAKQLFDAVFAMRSPKLRFAISATEETFDDCMNVSGRSLDSVPIIHVQEHNEADIKQFIDSELKHPKHKSLQGDAAAISRIVTTVRQKLPDIANGNFNNVSQVIERVNEAVESEHLEEDIEGLISADTLKNKDVMIERLIKDLNDSLNVQEIEQLNELLIWTTYAFKWMTVAEMQAALFLRTKRAPLQNLEDKIREKFSKVLRVTSGGTLEPKDWDLDDFFEKSKRVKERDDLKKNDDPSISMTININNVKLSKVQRFFWDLSEKIVLDKFAFTESLVGSAPTATINANRFDGSLTLIRRCLDVLLDEPKEETKILSRYALQYLPRHFQELREDLDKAGQDIDEDTVEPVERQEIVESLVNLLQSADCIERHLTDGFLLDGCWLDEKYGYGAIWTWLCDSEAPGRLNRKDLGWLRQMTSGNKLLALKDVALMITRQWLCHREFPAASPFKWIDLFLDQMSLNQGQAQTSKQSPDLSERGNDLEEENVNGTARPDTTERSISSQERISRALEWAENEAKITDKDSLWHSRLGATYLSFEETGLSKKHFLAAKELPNCSWMTSKALALAYAMDGDTEMAIQEMDVAFDYLRKQENLAAREKIDFISNLVQSADWHLQLRNKAMALEQLKEAVQVDPDNYSGHYALLKLFIDIGQESEAWNLLREMSTQSSKRDGLTRFGSMLLEFSFWSEPFACFEMVFRATKNDDDMFQVVSETLQSTVDFARESKETYDRVGLLLAHGLALAHNSTEEKDMQAALASWRESSQLGFGPAGTEKTQESALSAATHIFHYHLSRALSVPSTSVEFKSHEARLEELTESTGSVPRAARALRCSLGSFYSLSGRDDMARKVLLNDMKTGLDLLSDDDPGNDYLAFLFIGCLLMYTRDDLNALSAFSLFGPTERYFDEDAEEEEGHEANKPESEASLAKAKSPAKKAPDTSSLFECDGKCGNNLTFSDRMWYCKVCDTGFDDECLQKLKDGTLPRFVCSPDHQWLRTPSWVDEFRSTGKGRVRIEGELQNGERAGGRIVPVEEWLDMIREKWGIKKAGDDTLLTDSKKASEEISSEDSKKTG
ncbi:MAG: hypothetical protein M1821_002791 [Bathelium mastoideum]|nr:MAG: hypothetical protein M1821_002791 [Bathelium mastoideum]